MNRFFHLYFAGGRYDQQQGMPLTALPGVAKIERLVRSVARDLFFDGHVDRKRVPPGFDDAFSPVITRLVGGGSANCDVSWSPVDPDGTSAWFEAAQTEILELLETFGHDAPAAPPWLSQESAGLLADVLDFINDDESVTWGADEGDGVTVDVAVRERVRSEALRPRPAREEPFQVVGRLCRVSDKPWAVGVHIWETRRPMTVPVQQALKGKITQAWEHNDTTLVRLTGIASRDAEGHRRFVEATAIDVIGGPPLTARIDELTRIEDGWLGDEQEARVPTRRALVQVERSLWGLIERCGVDRPYVFLQPDAGIEALWRTESRTVSVRFSTVGEPSIVGVSVDRGARTALRTEAVPTLERLDAWILQQVGAVP